METFTELLDLWPVNFSHKGQWSEALIVSFIWAWKKRLGKQSRRRWFEMPWRSLWRHCNVIKFLNAHHLQYIPRNMHTVFALLCFVVVIHWLIFPYPSGLLHWHCGNITIAPVPAKQPWWIWIYTSCEFIMNECITTTKQSTTKPCAYFLGYTVSCYKDRSRTWISNSMSTVTSQIIGAPNPKNFSDCPLVLQLLLAHPLKPGFKLRVKM